MNYEIVLATNNKHKLKEVREILTPEGIIVYGLSDLGLKPEEVEENGNTYFENALIKAKSVQKLTSMPVNVTKTTLPKIFKLKFARGSELFS